MSVHLQTNSVLITPSEHRELRFEGIPAAIRRAGFVPGEMTLRARGAYVLDDGELAFLIHGWPRPLRVRAAPPSATEAVPEGETLLLARVDYSGSSIVLEPLPPEARRERRGHQPPAWD